MMVFAAIVQRVVDNDKGTCDMGYGRAPTPYQLFQRFPGLYSLVVSELVDIVGASSITHQEEKEYEQITSKMQTQDHFEQQQQHHHIYMQQD